MSDNNIPQEILVITGPVRPDDRHLEPRRERGARRLPNLTSVDISSLQGQVSIFLQQLKQVISETPDKVGGFRLSEFEMSAGIVVEAKGGVKLALLPNAEAGGGINA
jgi:hypothetical protein